MIQPTTVSNAQVVHQALISMSVKNKMDDWKVAHVLYRLRRFDLWRFSVGGIDSWEDYLKQPEIGISRHKADRLVRIYEYFIVERRMSVELLTDVPWSALDLLSKKNVFGQNLLDLLEAAKHVTPKDFKETLFDVTDGGDRTYSYLIMKKCDQTGNLEKVHDPAITSDLIKESFQLD